MVKDWPLEQPSAVAETSEGPSRLIADVQLGSGFPLGFGVVDSDFLPLQMPKFLLYSANLQLGKNHGRLTESVIFTDICHSGQRIFQLFINRPIFLSQKRLS